VTTSFSVCANDFLLLAFCFNGETTSSDEFDVTLVTVFILGLPCGTTGSFSRT
jgi:hypothetical protein